MEQQLGQQLEQQLEQHQLEQQLGQQQHHLEQQLELRQREQHSVRALEEHQLEAFEQLRDQLCALERHALEQQEAAAAAPEAAGEAATAALASGDDGWRKVGDSVASEGDDWQSARANWMAMYTGYSRLPVRRSSSSGWSSVSALTGPTRPMPAAAAALSGPAMAPNVAASHGPFSVVTWMAYEDRRLQDAAAPATPAHSDPGGHHPDDQPGVSYWKPASAPASP